MDNEEKTDSLTPESETKGTEVQAPSGELQTKKQKAAREAARWGMITLSSIIMGCSVYFFQTPYGITLGGIAGISFLLEKVALTQGIWMLIINGVLTVLGLIILGKDCTIRTVYATAIYTGTVNLLELIGKATNLQHPITGNADPILALLYAIILYGVGGAIIFNCGASSGGTDIIALIFKKFTHINVGIALLIVDFTVICVSVMALDSREIVFYSFMGLIIKNFLLDSVIEGLGRTKYLTVITSMPDEIGKYILEKVHHGYTIYDARGGYTGDEKKIIITICKRNEAWKLKNKIKQIDPSSFVIISNANEIMGKGFGGTAL